MKTLAAISIVFLMFFVPLSLKATHLMGGNLTYTYVSFNSQNNTHTYQVTLKIYRYCTGSTASLDGSTIIGVYANDPLFPNANKQLVITVTAPLVSQSFIQPPNSNPNCTFSANACVQEGIYQVNLTVASTLGGYHLTADRCCRNNNIMNLASPGAAGQSYHAFIPPTSIVNSSPTFAIPPVPFMCANDTTSILNSAFDPDGDSLVYTFETPYNGISASGNAIPNPPFTYPWPVSEVNYAGGYSVTNPFGAGGFAGINSATGLTTYYSGTAGFFVIAVEIKEYRNGVLIGITRRDLQVIVINCPPNPAPVLSTAAGSGQTSITIEEGATVCFPVTFTDANLDSIYITANGPIFNATSTNPAATFTIASGVGSASAQFCWTTSCSQGSSNPYQFVVTATDNGCPAKITNTVYTINVLPATISSIAGQDTFCLSQTTGNSYSVVNNPTNTYAWQISGGTQTSGGNTNAIAINWTSSTGSVSAWAINPEGCHSDTVSKNVLSLNPAANAGPDITLCTGQSVTIGTSGNPGYSYLWFPSNGLSSNSLSNPVFTAGSSAEELMFILSASTMGCAAYDTISVTVNPSPVVLFTSPGNSCIDDAAITLTGGNPSGGTYSGNGVVNGTFNPSQAGLGNHTLTYSFTTSTGCSGQATAHVTVHPVPVVSLVLPDTVNMNDPAFSLSGGLPSGGTYSGAGVSGGIFNPSIAGTGFHVITYSYTNTNGCINTATASIFVNLIVTSLDPFADVCIDEAPFTLTGGLPAGGNYSGTGVLNGMFYPSNAGVGTHSITYSYPNAVPVSATITVNELPTVSVSVSPSIGCQSNTIFVGYGPQELLITATSATAISYQWYLDGNQIAGATSSTHQATVAGTYSVGVIDANGCQSSLLASTVITNINVVDVRCGNGLKKIVLCHVPPGNPGNPQTLCIALSAVPAHLTNHAGDCIGPCDLFFDSRNVIIDDLHYHLSPNPVKEKAELSFMTFRSGNVKIDLLDLMGRNVKSIYNELTEGDIEYTIEIDAAGIIAGIYFLRIESPDGVVTEKITIIK